MRIEILDDHSVENICKHVVDADAILARTADYPAAVFEAGKKLKVIARHGAGVDNFDIDAATAHGVGYAGRRCELQLRSRAYDDDDSGMRQEYHSSRIKPAGQQTTTAETV